MSPIKYDPESQSFYESEGWRSWGCVTAPVQYMLTLIFIVWTAVLSIIIALPYILVCIAIGFVIAMLFGYI